MKVVSLVAATLACAAFAAGPAAAQPGYGAGAVRSDARGLGVGLQLNGTGISWLADEQRTAGAGLGLTLSYGVKDRLSVFTRASSGYRSSQLDLGARYRFASPTSALRPYLEVSVNRLAASRGAPDGQSLRSWGLGASVGAGVEYYLSPNLALDVGVTHTRGRFVAPAFQGGPTGLNERFSSNRLQMGVTWRP